MRAIPFELGCVGASFIKRHDRFLLDLILFESEHYQEFCNLRVQIRLMSAIQMQEQIDGLRTGSPVWDNPESNWDALNRQKAERLVKYLASPFWSFAGIDQVNNLSVLYDAASNSHDRRGDRFILCDGSKQYTFCASQMEGAKGNKLPKNVLNSFRATVFDKTDWSLEPLRVSSTNHL